MHSPSMTKQRGATFLGTLTIVSILGLALYAGIRLVPKYIEYFSAVKAMKEVGNQFDGRTPTVSEVRRALEARWTVDYISDVQPKDIEIAPGPNGGLVMDLDYETQAPFIGNVSFAVAFQSSVTISGGGRAY